MSDVKNNADKVLEQHICQALGTLAQRQRLMDQWEQTARQQEQQTAPKVACAARPVAAMRRRHLVPLGIVAAFAVLITAGYGFYQASTRKAEYAQQLQQAPLRSASPTTDIALLIEQQDYQSALTAIDSEECALSAQAQQTAAAGLLSEEQEYAQLLLQDEAYQLRWLRIEALVGLDRTNEARTLLTAFAQEEGEWQQQAQNLLNRLGK